MVDMSQRKYRLDVCPVCKVKKRFSLKKRVYQCSYCERWFCKKHLKPKVSVFSPTQITIKDLAWKNFVEREWKRKDGHPDYVYTKEKMAELGVEEEVTGAKPTRVKSNLTKTSVNCPQCDSERIIVTASGEQYDALKCLDCAFKWKHFKFTVYEERQKRKKKIPIKKIAVLLTSIIILTVIVLNGPIIYSAFQNSMQQSSYTKVTVVEGQVARVEFEDNVYAFAYMHEQFVIITPLAGFRYYDVVEGAVYSDLGIEIVVSEVHSDYIVLLLKPKY